MAHPARRWFRHKPSGAPLMIFWHGTPKLLKMSWYAVRVCSAPKFKPLMESIDRVAGTDAVACTKPTECAARMPIKSKPSTRLV